MLAQAAPAKKRRKPLKMALLAAALALVGVLCVAAGLPGLVYQLANGILTFTQTSNSKIATVFSDVIMNLEDGRVFSLLNDEHVDITDRISQDTPYIIDCSDPEAGLTHFVVMGGTPEHYGWFEWIVTPDPFTYEEFSRPTFIIPIGGCVLRTVPGKPIAPGTLSAMAALHGMTRWTFPFGCLRPSKNWISLMSILKMSLPFTGNK